MKTFSPKPSDITRRWWVIDADGQVLGRMATDAARLLRGKHKAIFAPHMDTGDYVVIINARNVRLTGRKLDQKLAYRHSGYPGGLRSMTYRTFMEKKPTEAVRKAIKGMLPHNRLGRAMIDKLKVYEGAEHPHVGQNPQPYKREEAS